MYINLYVHKHTYKYQRIICIDYIPVYRRGPKYEELDISIYVFIALCAYFLVQKPLFLELQILNGIEIEIKIE